MRTHARVAPERRAGKLLERLDGWAFDSREGIQDLETPKGVESLLDHLRMHFEPIDVFRQGRVVNEFVGDFERQPDEEVDVLKAILGELVVLIRLKVVARVARVALVVNSMHFSIWISKDLACAK